jgi:hypothetical protein
LVAELVASISRIIKIAKRPLPLTIYPGYRMWVREQRMFENIVKPVDI